MNPSRKSATACTRKTATVSLPTRLKLIKLPTASLVSENRCPRDRVHTAPGTGVPSPASVPGDEPLLYGPDQSNPISDSAWPEVGLGRIGPKIHHRVVLSDLIGNAWSRANSKIIDLGLCLEHKTRTRVGSKLSRPLAIIVLVGSISGRKIISNNPWSDQNRATRKINLFWGVRSDKMYFWAGLP